jgi:hypothetical protein
MKIAVLQHRRGDEILIFAVKGKENNFSCVDGLEEYFDLYGTDGPGEKGRKLQDYEVKVGHIGAGDALVLVTHMEIGFDREIEGNPDEDWFEDDDDCTPRFGKKPDKKADNLDRRVCQHLDDTITGYTSKIPGFDDLPMDARCAALEKMNNAVHEAYTHASKST